MNSDVQTWDWPEIKKMENIFCCKTLLFQSNFKQFLTSSMYSAYILILNSFFWYTRNLLYFWSSAMHWAAKLLVYGDIPSQKKWCILKWLNLWSNEKNVFVMGAHCTFSIGHRGSARGVRGHTSQENFFKKVQFGTF